MTTLTIEICITSKVPTDKNDFKVHKTSPTESSHTQEKLDSIWQGFLL